MKTFKQLRESHEGKFEADNGDAWWIVGAIINDKDEVVTELYDFDEETWNSLSEEEKSWFDDINEEEYEIVEGDLDERFKGMTKTQTRLRQLNRDKSKHKNRADKLRARIKYKKGGNRIKRKKYIKLRQRRDGSKIKSKFKARGGVKGISHSKFTKK